METTNALPDTMQVTITKELIERSGDYIDHQNCPLAVFLKEMFPEKSIMVYGTWLEIDNIHYDFNYSFENGWCPSRLWQIKAEKEGPITFKLTKR